MTFDLQRHVSVCVECACVLISAKNAGLCTTDSELFTASFKTGVESRVIRSQSRVTVPGSHDASADHTADPLCFHTVTTSSTLFNI